MGDYAPLGREREGAKCLGIWAMLERLPIKEYYYIIIS
jgi:hypothetical protein